MLLAEDCRQERTITVAALRGSKLHKVGKRDDNTHLTFARGKYIATNWILVIWILKRALLEITSWLCWCNERRRILVVTVHLTPCESWVLRSWECSRYGSHCAEACGITSEEFWLDSVFCEESLLQNLGCYCTPYLMWKLSFAFLQMLYVMLSDCAEACGITSEDFGWIW